MDGSETKDAPGSASERAGVLERLNDIFHDVVSDDVDLTYSTTAEDVPEWDSLAHVRLILAVERAFKTRLSAAQIARLNNVGDLVAVIAVSAKSQA